MKKTIAFLLTLAVMAGLLALPASAAGFTPPFDVAAHKQREYDKLADLIRSSLDMQAVYDIVEKGV